MRFRAGSVTGKQLRVSQQNPAGQGYPANTGMVALTSSYVYDNEGKMTSVTYPSVSNYSATFTTTYDGMSRPFGLSDQGNDFIVNSVTYGPSNELLTMGYAGCLGCQPYIETRTYNSRLQLTSIGALQYIYPTGGANNGKAIEQKVTSGEDVVYSYDALNRLILAQTTASSSTTWGQSFTYDGFGNLYQKTPTQGSAPAMSATVNAATNQLSLGNYDANGNLYEIPGINGGSPTYYAIDIENRMVSVNTTGSPTGVATYWYGYDPGNRRVWKGTYDSNGNLTAQEAYFYSPSGQKLGTYSLWLNNYPPSNDVAVATDIQVFFGAKRVGHSEPGNPTIIGPVTQDRVGSFGSYYPYGEDKGSPLLPNDQWKFATYTRDSATGLDYAVNRYYSSAWGRFVSADPSRKGSIASLPPSWNRYSYANSDPVNAADPTGLWTCYFVDGQLDSCDDSQDLDPAYSAPGSTQNQSQALALAQQLARVQLTGAFNLALQGLQKSGCLQLFENNGVPLKDPLTGGTLDPVAVLTGLYRAGEGGVNTGWASVSFGIIGTDASTTANYSDLGLNSSGPYYSTTSVTFNVRVWNTSSVLTDATLLLHELGHVINLLAAGFGSQNGIASDGSSNDASLANTVAVNNNCFTKGN